MPNPKSSPLNIDPAKAALRPSIPPELVLPQGLDAEALKDLHPLIPKLIETIVKITAAWRTQTVEVVRLTEEVALLHNEKSALLAQMVGHSDQPKH